MAVRRPLFVTANGNLQEMTDSQVSELISLACWKYAETEYMTWDVFKQPLYDARKQAGSEVSNASTFPSAADTPDPSVLSEVHYGPLPQFSAQTVPTESGYTYPVYFDGSNIRAMTKTDFKDTIIKPAIDRLLSSTMSNDTNGTYVIKAFSGAHATIPYVEGYTGKMLAFVDTRADPTQFNAPPETLDQPMTVTSYFLYRQNQSSIPSYTNPVFTNAAGNILSKNHSSAELSTALNLILSCATSSQAEWSDEPYSMSNSLRISYLYDNDTNRGIGTTRGTIIDTMHSEIGRLTRESGGDYFAQEFPNGAIVTNWYSNFNIYKQIG